MNRSRRTMLQFQSANGIVDIGEAALESLDLRCEKGRTL